MARGNQPWSIGAKRGGRGEDKREGGEGCDRGGRGIGGEELGEGAAGAEPGFPVIRGDGHRGVQKTMNLAMK